MKLVVHNSTFSDYTNCMFVAVLFSTKNSSATISQRINVIRYASVFNRTLVKIRITGDCNNYVKFIVIERNITDEILNT
ncbi:unnamed protein product [Adineta steineri]|uniref:Uncharacterized protein n=1 Tax=Adineta steineri TaxID=433720 RepID=A0A814M7T6_9BILA|nr:unnamed protein product [Adineta steineri]CAF1075949.1 unnamed protein product [Adineta steineri]CAF3874651.1 unnamed protein product [Adineta steineri]CAF4164411.1 unnamed protein product [Adineta steineri]